MECKSDTIVQSEDCDKDDETRIKEENFYLDEIPSDAQKLHLLQNGMYFVECGETSDVNTKTGIKQETCNKNVVSSDIKSSSEEPATCIGTGTIKVNDDEIQIKEEPWWFDRTSTGAHSDKKESELGKHETSADMLQLESTRCPTEAICPHGLPFNTSDVEPDVACNKAEYGINTKKRTPNRQNIPTLNCNPPYNTECFESKQYMNEESTAGYKCKHCVKCFTERSELQQHTLLHAGTKPYKCEHCEQYFTQKRSLRRHTLLHSSIKPYKCDLCEKCFKEKSNLKQHIILHSGIKPYKCEICEKSFAKKTDLKTHFILHSGTKPYKCDICDRCFTYKSSLRTHKLVHSGKKTYKCDKCEKCYSDKSSLNKHKMWHSGLKPYKCDVCQKCFRLKRSLKSHIFLHSGTKPYNCDICDKGFNYKSNLNRHKLLHLTT